MEFEILFRQYLNTLIWALLLALIFYLPERFSPAENGQPLNKRIANLIYTPIVIAIILLLQPLFGPLFTFALVSTNGGLLGLSQPSSLPGQLVFALAFAVGWDIWSYWVHRLQHTNSFLWQSHKFHHTETALNSTTQARHHALHYVVSLIAYLPVIAVFGALQPHFIAVFLMFRLWGFVNHANVRLSLGPLTPVVAGPQWHRIHHSILAEHYNRNFATFFPFIDIFFGTYYRPHRREFPATGLTDEEKTTDLCEATVAPLFALSNMAHLHLMKLKVIKQSGPET